MRHTQTIHEFIRNSKIDFRVAWVQYEHMIEPEDIRGFTLQELQLAVKVCSRHFERQINSEIWIRSRNTVI